MSLLEGLLPLGGFHGKPRKCLASVSRVLRWSDFVTVVFEATQGECQFVSRLSPRLFSFAVLKGNEKGNPGQNGREVRFLKKEIPIL